jgi:hypothetical protein
MNHSGDTNKMVDTPRTDAAKKIVLGGVGGDWEVVHIAFSRQLERELNAANERIQSLIEERDRANRLAEWKWNLRDEFQLLLGTDKIEEGIEAVKELKRRIKRLEEVTQERDKEWFQVIESILGFHPVSMTEALRIGIERIKKQKQRIQRLVEAGDALFELCDASPIQFELVDQIPQRLKAWEEAKEAKP